MQSGFELMLVGMGTVFGFLVVLVVLLEGIGRAAQRWLPEDLLSSASMETDRRRKMAVAAAVALSQRAGK